MENVDRCRSRHPPSPMRVTSSALDPRRHWYVVTKDLCGSRPKEFAKGEVFPDEIQSVDPRHLKPASGEGDLNRQPSYLIAQLLDRPIVSDNESLPKVDLCVLPNFHKLLI